MAELYSNTIAFEYDSNTGTFRGEIAEGAPAIETGKVYTVTFGALRYVCEAYDATLTVGETSVACVAVGARVVLDSYLTGTLESTVEPFVYLYMDGIGEFYANNVPDWQEVRVYDGLDNPEGYLMYERTIGFDTSDSGVANSTVNVKAPVITAGNLYTVVWDNVYYKIVADEIDAGGLTAVVVGNKVFVDETAEDTGEPFAYVYISSASVGAFNTNVSGDVHVVSIYDGDLKINVKDKVLWFDTETRSGLRTANLSEPSMPITAGETYTVTYDGTDYSTVAKNASIPLGGENVDCVVLGNLSIANIGAENTGEPFIYAYRAGELVRSFELSEPDVYVSALGMMFHKMMDLTPSYTQMIGATFKFSQYDSETGEWSAEYVANPTPSDAVINEDRGVAFIVGDNGLCVAYRSGLLEADIATVDLPEKGLFFTWTDVENFIPIRGSLTASDYAWFVSNDTADEHTVSIVEGGGSVTNGDSANIVLYDRNGNPQTYEGIKTVSFDTDDGGRATYTYGTAVEKETVTLNLANGNQTVSPSSGSFMKSVEIKKPSTLVAENIAKDVEIAGVVGTMEGGISEGVSKEIELNLADGDQTVEADPNNLMSEVVIKKPDTLIPENIVKDVNIAGVVGNSEGGGGGGEAVSVTPSDINFYDYDGTLVAAWTLDELATATELPANPSHEGLTAQGWNWSLEDLKSTNRAMNVGQMYITSDEKTRIYIRIANVERMVVPLCFSQTVSNGVTIDWGDASALQVLSGTGNVRVTHTYASIGDYVITLDPVDGCAINFGIGTSGNGIFGNTTSADRAYFGMLRKLELGKGFASINAYAFQYCPRLESLTVPSGITNIGVSAMSSCPSLVCFIVPDTVLTIDARAFAYSSGLKSVSIPNGITNLALGLFESCGGLRQLTIPNGITSVEAQAISGCASLENFTIPDSVSSVGERAFQTAYSVPRFTVPANILSIPAYAFYCNYGAAEYHMKRTSPPTLANTNAFYGIPADCIIYVPKGNLSAYTSATNWSTYASQMQEEP